jgi:hypothetical protein
MFKFDLPFGAVVRINDREHYHLGNGVFCCDENPNLIEVTVPEGTPRQDTFTLSDHPAREGQWLWRVVLHDDLYARVSVPDSV